MRKHKPHAKTAHKNVTKKGSHRLQALRLSRSFTGVDNTKDIDLILEKSKLYQDVLGFSNERVGALFISAVQLMQQHRYDEAIKACQLLTQLNPFVADFWICLGMAEQANGAFIRAREAFLTAQTMDPARAEPYVLAIDCSLELNDTMQAYVIYQAAFKYAKKHARTAESQLLLKELALRQDMIERELKHIEELL